VKLLLELQSDENCDHSTNEIQGAQIYPAIPYTSLQSVRTILTRLDTQASQILARRKTRLRPEPETTVPRIRHNALCPFTSLEEARSESDYLWNYCLYSLQPRPADDPSHLIRPQLDRVHECARRQSQWSAAFEIFLQSSKHKLNAQEQQAANVMRIYKIIGTMSLGMDYSADVDDESVWDAHDMDFAAIVSLANMVIDSSADAALAADSARFSLDTCVVGPLYLVATRCRHKILRRKAISLLRLSPRLEGLWDSNLLAQVAERVLGIEESDGGGRECESEAGAGRVSDVDVEFDLEGRRASVRYLHQVGDAAAAETMRQDLIEW
jgi:hypothetical protein